MTPVEVIALVFAVVILVKAAIVSFVDSRRMMRLVRKWFVNSILLNIIFTVLIVVVGYFLLLELTIVQIVACSLFGMFLYGLIAAAYPDSYVRLAEDVLDDKKKSMYMSGVMVVLSIWVLVVLFG